MTNRKSYKVVLVQNMGLGLRLSPKTTTVMARICQKTCASIVVISIVTVTVIAIVIMIGIIPSSRGIAKVLL